MDEAYKEKLKNQGYCFVGETTALKICGWTKNSIRGKGTCYKEKFYGINCHRCVQMSPTVNFCQLDCIYCWRERHNSPFTKIDEPEEIIDNCIKGQQKMLTGFKGNPNADVKKYEEAQDPKHFAISLSGEPTAYPKISELIKACHKRGISTFLVTNGMMPEVLETIEKPTQLYLSLDGNTEEQFLELARPMIKDAWPRLLKSLDFLKKNHDTIRTTIRYTCIKGINMNTPQGMAKFLELGEPRFLELKGYMFLGASTEKLKIENMPYHEDVVEYAKKVEKLTNYKIIDEQPESRVVLMMKDNPQDRWIDFEKVKQ